MADELIFLL